MNVFLLTAHPERRSFNFALSNQAEALLRAQGHAVQRSDLCQQGFQAVAGPADVPGFPGEPPFQLARAQREAAQWGGFATDIQREQALLVWADVLLVQFPLWWGGYPAVLKGWIERVLSYGFAYGRQHTLPPRRYALSATSGGADDAQEEAAYDAQLARLGSEVFGYMGWTSVGPFIAHGPASTDDAGRQRLLQQHAAWLQGWSGLPAPAAR